MIKVTVEYLIDLNDISLAAGQVTAAINQQTYGSYYMDRNSKIRVVKAEVVNEPEKSYEAD